MTISPMQHDFIRRDEFNTLKNDMNAGFDQTFRMIVQLGDRLEAKIDKIDAKVDSKIDQLERKMDQRFREQKEYMDAGFELVFERFERLERR